LLFARRRRDSYVAAELERRIDTFGGTNSGRLSAAQPNGEVVTSSP